MPLCPCLMQEHREQQQQQKLVVMLAVLQTPRSSWRPTVLARLGQAGAQEQHPQQQQWRTAWLGQGTVAGQLVGSSRRRRSQEVVRRSGA